MDPDPSLNNTFLECMTKIKPYIAYEEKNGVKTFDTISMIEENNIVFSKVKLDSHYKLLHGEIIALTLTPEEYLGIKRAIIQGASLTDLIYSTMHPLEVSRLTKDSNSQKFEMLNNGKMIEIPSNFSNINSVAIEDKYLRSKPDRINNYIIKYGDLSGVPTNVFREIEKESETNQFRVIVTSKSKIKVKSA